MFDVCQVEEGVIVSSMRIAVVGSYANSLINFRGPLLKAMVDCGHEVIACAPEAPQNVVAVLAEMGVTYRDIFLYRTGTNPLADVKTWCSLRRFFEQYRPDIALLYTIKPVIYGSLAAKYAHVPNVFSMITGAGYVFGESSLRQRLIRTIIRPMYRAALHSNRKVFFQNPDDQELFARMRFTTGSDQCVLINGSGVDIDHYHKVPPTTSPMVFLLIARLISEKGINEYVELRNVGLEQISGCDFRLVGSIDSNPSAISQKKIQEWCHEGVIEYLGETRDVRPYIAECSVYVLPSYREGTPRTVLSYVHGAAHCYNRCTWM